MKRQGTLSKPTGLVKAAALSTAVVIGRIPRAPSSSGSLEIVRGNVCNKLSTDLVGAEHSKH